MGRNRVSSDALGWVWRHSPYRGSTFLVHLAIADTANDQHYNELWMSQSTVAKKARTDRKTVNQALRILCQDGMLTLLEEHRGKPSRFRFEFPQAEVAFDTRVRRETPPLGSETPPTCGVRPHELKKNSSKPKPATPTKRRVFLQGTGWMDIS